MFAARHMLRARAPLQRFASSGASLSPDWMYHSLATHGIDFYAGVPDSLLKEFCAYVMDNTPPERHFITANEGGAVALALGHYLATGRTSLVYMQNSGLGNAVNPLTSLADKQVYSIPMMLMVGWRGQPGVPDEPQHVKMGAITKDMLDIMGIPAFVVPRTKGEAAAVVAEAFAYTQAESAPAALVVEKDTFAKYKPKFITDSKLKLSREEAIQNVVEHLEDNAFIVSTTGKASRELYETRESRGEQQRDFLTVGGMGHASQIALGVAMSNPHVRTICIDGDGAMLMHLGSLGLVGASAPPNFVHILINNGAHESVGGQPTLCHHLSLPGAARSSGYRHAVTVDNVESLRAALALARSRDGPHLIEVLTNLDCRNDLGRPKSSSLENRKAVEAYLRSI